MRISPPAFASPSKLELLNVPLDMLVQTLEALSTRSPLSLKTLDLSRVTDLPMPALVSRLSVLPGLEILVLPASFTNAGRARVHLSCWPTARYV